MIKRISVLLLFIAFSSSFAQNFNKAKLDSLFQILETKDKFMGSIAMAENGKLIYTKSIGKDDIETNKHSTINTKYRIGSISKMFTACMVFQAIEENKLNLDQTIDLYFPTVENAKKITIGNLLNHRSGIHNFTDDPDYIKYNTQPKSEKEMVELISKGKSEFEPDTKGEYSNSNYVLLSYILEKVYKKPFKEILNTKIVKPLGLKNTYFGGKININNNESNSYRFTSKWDKETETDPSIAMGAGGIVSNPTDLVVFINNLFSNKIVSEKSLQQMETIKDKFGMGILKFPYYDIICFGHTGGIDGFLSAITYFPDSHLALALTSNGILYNTNDVLIGALSCYYNKPFDIPTFKTIDLKTEDLDPYLGEYSSPDFPLNITITKVNLKLFAQATGQSAFPLDAVEKDKFEFLAAGLKIDFNPIENQLTLNQGGRKFTLTKVK
jgi:D-alanyl-D-alanine carboxypeptidase